MSLDYELLRVLHHKLKLRTEYESQIARGPRKIELAKATEKKFGQELDAAKEAHTKSKLMAHERQLQLNEREARIENLKGRRNAAESNKEYQILNDQIAADEKANSVLSDEIFELLEKIDHYDAKVQDAKRNHEKSILEFKNTAENIEKELVVQKARLAAVVDEIANLEKQLPGEIKPEYRRQVSAKSDDALSCSNQETCGNCNQRLSPQTRSDLAMQRPVFCTGCGSLMYASAKSTARS